MLTVEHTVLHKLTDFFNDRLRLLFVEGLSAMEAQLTSSKESLPARIGLSSRFSWFFIVLLFLKEGQ